MAIRAVLLDLDETILDNETSAALAWEQFRTGLQAQGVLLPWKDLEQTYPTVAYERWVLLESQDSSLKPTEFRISVFAETLERLGLSQVKAPELGRFYEECQIATYRAFDDLADTLNLLRQNYRLGIVSNGWPDYQREKLKTLGITDFFKTLIFSKEAGSAKPDERIFQKACESLSVQPQEALMVGDNPRLDGEGALAAGLHSVWLNRTAREAATPLPDRLGLITRFHELPLWIQTVEGGIAPPQWWISPEK